MRLKVDLLPTSLHPVTAAMTLLLAYFGKKECIRIVYENETEPFPSVEACFVPVNPFYFRTGFVKAEIFLQMACFSCFKLSSKEVTDGDFDFNHSQGNGKGGTYKEKGKTLCNQRAAANVARSFTFRELAASTQNFRVANLIGEGGFGSVYKGRLDSGKFTTLWRSYLYKGTSKYHLKQGRAVGCCKKAQPEWPTREPRIHSRDLKPHQQPLDWHTRLKIALGAARGLEYLHCIANPPSRPFLKDRKKFVQLADPLLEGHFPTRCMHHAVAITAMCLQEQANFRPLVGDIVVALEYLASQAEISETPRASAFDSRPSPSRKENNNVSRERLTKGRAYEWMGLKSDSDVSNGIIICSCLGNREIDQVVDKVYASLHQMNECKLKSQE
ncbi:protein kinase superfamily protein [Artemisia annua]|uniref:Protein kinase superfamily protein n=1 Tax=Artemisia annua TaxID=35608 RepID=A0A2U1N3D2_ARTAN|nr:protein kinase superfamily protein [Artemisia annua]